MVYTYTTYKTAIQNAIAGEGINPAFDTIYDPSLISYAELRIYRELNLLNTVQRLSNTNCVTGNRNFSIDHSFVVVNGINILTPVGSTTTDGIRTPLVPVSLNMMDVLWPGNAVTDVPKLFAMVDQWNLALGPAPDDTYAVEVVGTYRPAQLSASNPTTFLSTYLPDLFFAAGMVFVSGWMRNFGEQASDPKMAMSWETQYQTLKASANSEELRKFQFGDSWTAYQPPAGTQARG